MMMIMMFVIIVVIIIIIVSGGSSTTTTTTRRAPYRRLLPIIGILYHAVTVGHRGVVLTATETSDFASSRLVALSFR